MRNANMQDHKTYVQNYQRCQIKTKSDSKSSIYLTFKGRTPVWQERENYSFVILDRSVLFSTHQKNGESLWDSAKRVVKKDFIS